MQRRAAAKKSRARGRAVARPGRISAAGTAGLCLLGALWGGCGDSDEGASIETESVTETPFAALEEDGFLRLYFPGPDGLLYAEERRLQPESEPESLILQLASAVLEGPADPALSAPFSRRLEVGSIDLSNDGLIFLDLQSEDGAPPRPRGSTEELLALYSLVNSIVLNLEGARAVVLLWNGRQLETLSGHIETSRPIGPDPTLIAGPIEEFEFLEEGDRE